MYRNSDVGRVNKKHLTCRKAKHYGKVVKCTIGEKHHRMEFTIGEKGNASS